MAEFGANHPCFKREEASLGVVLGRLVEANLTVNLASGEMYADDELAEQLSEFSSGSLALSTDDMTDENSQEVYGCRVEDGTVIYNKNDTCPLGVLAYYKVLMRRGVKYYKGYFYPRVRAALGNDNAQTRGNAITFTPTQTTFTVFTDDNGDWRKTKTFNSASDAAAWCEELTGVSDAFAVNVSSQGEGEGDGVDLKGTSYVAAGEDVVITITGTPSAVYDNGENVTSSVSGGTYTISAIDEDHTIAVIF